MTPFTKCQSTAACMMESNIDTDAIFPARYLLLLDREGMGEYLFYDRRFDASGTPDNSFVLNDPKFTAAQVIIAGEGFGCGSSREQAVWALSGFGIRCVIAPSFGDIFKNNCLKNGILILELPIAMVENLAAQAASGAWINVDLPSRRVSCETGLSTTFEIKLDTAKALLKGWDETMRILQEDGDDIAAFEARHRHSQPWLFSQRRCP
jgi:3-isopropylmalate/(R)-2-methylmalate dehydratase small subunit